MTSFCLHDWHLIDANRRVYPGTYSTSILKTVTVGCPKCQRTKTMTDEDYAYFKTKIRVTEAKH